MSVKVTGTIVRKTFGKGSKSEHQALYIETDKGDYVLRKRGDNPFENNGLAEMVGKKVEAKGTIQDYLLLADDIRVLDP